MRIVAIGIGGAGCRIVDKLYFADRKSKSGKNPCVEALAVDIDQKTIRDLKFLPEQSRMFFANLDPSQTESDINLLDMNEISGRVQSLVQGETDAILVCSGLGGRLTKAVPTLIEILRKTLVEPLFGLIALPANSDGDKRIADAADEIDKIQPLLDGTILFDNETWHRKIDAKVQAGKQKKSIIPVFGQKPKTPEEEEMEIYDRMNEAMVRRVSLILRAGEVASSGGKGGAEVVLDSGEILNTMLCDGYITIGYSIEHISKNPLKFILKKGSGSDLFADEQNAKASRIVELAKEAIYHEISTPCDMTSAQKALVLIAGPSHELSMKGFMTVRKWIDRSIEGIEVRSGDYPVENSSTVALIIVLAGVRNIPRLEELKEIRRQFLEGYSRRAARQQDFFTGDSRSTREISGKDQMIALPPKMGVGSSTKKPGKIPKKDTIIPEIENVATGGWDTTDSVGPARHPSSSGAKVQEKPHGFSDLDFWEDDDEGKEPSKLVREKVPSKGIAKQPKEMPYTEGEVFSEESDSRDYKAPTQTLQEEIPENPRELGENEQDDSEIPDSDKSLIEDQNPEIPILETQAETVNEENMHIGSPQPASEEKPAPPRHRLIRVSERPEKTPDTKTTSPSPVQPEPTPVLRQEPRRIMSHGSLSSRDALIRRPLPGSGTGISSSKNIPSRNTPSTGSPTTGENDTSRKTESQPPEKKTGVSRTNRNAFIAPPSRDSSMKASQVQPQVKRFQEPGVKINIRTPPGSQDETKNPEDLSKKQLEDKSSAKKKPEKEKS